MLGHFPIWLRSQCTICSDRMDMIFVVVIGCEAKAAPRCTAKALTIFRTQERGIGGHLDTYFGWPVTGSTDIRVV
jgi:hypothetical protein